MPVIHMVAGAESVKPAALREETGSLSGEGKKMQISLNTLRLISLKSFNVGVDTT